MLVFCSELAVNGILLSIVNNTNQDDLKNLIVIILVRVIFMIVEKFWLNRKKNK